LNESVDIEFDIWIGALGRVSLVIFRNQALNRFTL